MRDVIDAELQARCRARAVLYLDTDAFFVDFTMNIFQFLAAHNVSLSNEVDGSTDVVVPTDCDNYGQVTRRVAI